MSLTRAGVRPALRMVADPDRLPVPRGCMALAEEAVALARLWSAADGIQGFGIAPRRVGGKPSGELVLKVYVDRKLPRDEVPEPVPRHVEIPWSRVKVPVDVEPIGKLRLHQGLTGVFRPAMPGCAIATPGAAPGSLGCLVRDPVEGGGTYVLSAAHVIAGHGPGPVGRPVLQPGTELGSGGVIGQLVRWGTIRFTEDTFPNLFDAALAVVDRKAVVPEIHAIGRPLGFSGIVTGGMDVQKCGATTGKTTGTVSDPDFHCTFFYPQQDGTFARAGFQKQVLCSNFSDGGDSGAAVLNTKGRIVGLLIGGAEGGTVFSPIVPILEQLGVAIA